MHYAIRFRHLKITVVFPARTIRTEVVLKAVVGATVYMLYYGDMLFTFSDCFPLLVHKLPFIQLTRE